ncbi:thiamine phosphate synthase [Xanthovirga aplysinae]|uniref:thiamine phosphate synthase n=1 Tax=Xanthovirga aplysinae TaxID=2529853 RepID=UPI0012BD213D|nr:thiamine phosphate synthase [Xanthovirga aplysinae]MTI33007.1 thiamine phosphate synthase [Xanthovirga aplysinae]
MIGKLQYISQENEAKDHLANIEEACQSGCDWIQLRLKSKTEEEARRLGQQAKKICEFYGSRLIINDHVWLAKEIQAEGVHLGKEDMPPSEARDILGKEVIIGGTANTFEDLETLSKSGVNYIGLGPFRFTTTKEKLSPVLGLEGYKDIINRAQQQGVDVPVIAIGGILSEDVETLLDVGLHGIAVSGLITQAKDKLRLVTDLKKKLYHEEITNS